jgi:hypothetical protein
MVPMLPHICAVRHARGQSRRLLAPMDTGPTSGYASSTARMLELAAGRATPPTS